MGDTGADPMESARYMAEISNRMQVPDRIMVSGDEQGGAATAPSPSRAAGEGKYNDLGMRQRDPRIDMQVRARIVKYKDCPSSEIVRFADSNLA